MVYAPTFRTVDTLLFTQRMMEAMSNIAPTNDPATTLNTKYSVDAGVDFSVGGRPKVQYFGIGINGFHNVEDENLSEPNEVLPTDMDLYTPLPIRCVPFEEDLSDVERANYRMRVVQTYGADQYVLYYLKKFTLLSAAAEFTITDGDGNESAYVIDPGNLSPTPPDPATQGVINAQANAINVSARAQLLVTAEEIAEAINVIYGGDMRYANISEIGIYMGEDQTRSAVDHTATPFNYTEAIMAQLAVHRTWNGVDMSAPGSVMDHTYVFTSESLTLTV